MARTDALVPRGGGGKDPATLVGWTVAIVIIIFDRHSVSYAVVFGGGPSLLNKGQCNENDGRKENTR